MGSFLSDYAGCNVS